MTLPISQHESGKVVPSAPSATGPRPDFAAARQRKRELLRELSESHADGRPISPEALLARWPTKPAADPDVASLLFEDYCRREQAGENPSRAEYECRFPEQCDSLASHFRQHGLLQSLAISRSEPAPLALPAVGEEVFGFRLRYDLGSGAFARVYLAEQVELAGRPMVLKISAAEGCEPQTLAQLQHTHIVPIYSQHENVAAGLRAVCMPFFGGASLSRVLGALWIETSQPARGQQIVAALRSVQAPALQDLPAAEASRSPGAMRAGAGPAEVQPLLARMERQSYIQAAAWIVACLADGLHHAHERGILHRDVKPSNILVGADGQPLLLDFNLSADVKNAAYRDAAGFGGTVAYMAPEHLRAMASRDPALARLVDRRADIYSLGMVLYEMLVGHKPFDQSASYAPLPALIEAMAVERGQVIPSPREHRADVPWGLESIVRKCLHPDVDRRYQRADALADDLRALLEDRPLRHAPELSRVDRVRKWTRRHPRLTAMVQVAACAALVIGGLSAGLAAAWSGWEASADRLVIAERREQMKQLDENTIRAYCLVGTTTDMQALDHDRQGMELCRDSLAPYGVLEHDDWQSAPLWGQLDAGPCLHLLENIREVLLLYAWARARSDAYRTDGLNEALGLVEKAERITGLAETSALWADRAFYLQKLGRKDEAEAAQARAAVTARTTARDHFLVATTAIRTEGPGSRTAAAALDQALQLAPQHFWALMQRGACRLENGDTLLAVSDFSEAIRARPEAALGYFNRGYAFARAGRHDAAVADYTAALERDPQLVLGYLNRALVLLEMKAYTRALADFDRAAALGRDEPAVHAGRAVALEGLGNHGDADAAFARALAGLGPQDTKARLRIWWAQGFAVSARAPAVAHAAFDGVLAVEPRHPQALYGKAMLAAQDDRLEEAVGYFQRALEADPGFVEARRFRAVLLARRGQLAQANRDINACLEREPRSGATLYAAACVAALALENADPLHAEDTATQALFFVEQAFRQGYGQDRAAQDADLATLRRLPAFQKLLTRTF